MKTPPFKLSVFIVASVVVATFRQPCAVAVEPVKITQCGGINKSGSYVLANNLAADGHCLVVTADSVTIDLGGFVITGGRSGAGIAGGGRNLAVRNGTVTQFGAGLSIRGANAIVEGVRAVGNGRGIATSSAAIRGNTVLDNSVVGIETTGVSTIIGNTVIGNLDGIVAAGGSIVSNNTVQANRAVGIAVPSRGVEGPGGLMSGNTVVGNGKEGILGGPGSLVSGNIVLNNGSVGIEVGADLVVSGSTVSGNTVQGNGGAGISVGGGSTVSNNTVGDGITGLCPSNVTQNTSVSGFSFSGKGCDFHDNVGDVTVLE
jgi:parallel beta-helix repeat protein